MKAASGLKNQDKPRKPRRNENLQQMTNVLLQICPDAEGAQRFQKGTSWAKRQEDGKYSLMSCRSIIAQLDVLLVLSQKMLKFEAFAYGTCCEIPGSPKTRHSSVFTIKTSFPCSLAQTRCVRIA